MKIVNLEQGSPEWLSWRRTVITATDCSAIMGSNSWVTPYKCWQRKLGLIPEQESNDAMERGKRLEPIARAQFIELFGINMTPVCVESTEYEFLGASLDGISDCRRYILEIKCGGQNLWDMAVKGIIPEYYMHQMQHQLLITGSDKCFYYVFDGNDGICIEVFPDPLFSDMFFTKARAWWRCVAFCEAPMMQEKDYKDMSGNLNWKEDARRYREIEAQIKALEKEKEFLRKNLLDLCDNQASCGNGIKVCKSRTTGKISYDEIPEIKGVDLEKYRKPSTTFWRILVS